MSYSKSTATALRFLFGDIDLTGGTHVLWRQRTGVGRLIWDRPEPKPTEQEILDALADLTTVNGQTFSQWQAEHGGDLRLTLRREAKEALAAASPGGVSLRTTLKAIGITQAQFIARIDAGDGDS